MANSHIGSRDIPSTSASSSSPPSTPPRRGRKYPSLLAKGDPGQVPSHRQDTSHTYERLEDLLREAGYAETRIFTPQTERFLDGDRRGNSDDGSSRRGGVVSFLAGLIPGASKQDEPAAHAHDPDFSLARKADRDKKFTNTPMTSHFETDSSGSSIGSPQLDHNAQLHPVRHNRPPIRLQTSSSQSPSAARALLRHMASAPNIPRRSDDNSSKYVLNEPGRVDKRPPMPSAWLSTVKHAVIKSNAVGAHTGGPHDRMARSTRTQSKKENDIAFATKPRGRSTFCLQPPQPTSVRAASPGPVNLVSVVCRSAPGSRSSSLVRGTSQRGTLEAVRLVQELKGKGRARTKTRKRLESSQRDSVPSLLASRVDGDAWHESFKLVDRDDDDDDEEGELNLAKLLVPPKRQHSIRSLRRHLDRHSNLLPTIAGVEVPGLEPWRPEDDSEDGPSMRRGRRQASPDEMDFKDWGTSEEVVKRRSRIPNRW